MAEQATATIEASDAPKAKPSYVWGTGRRKSAVARVRIAPGSGKIEINGRTLNEHFTNERDRKAIFGPLEVSNTGGKVDIWANCAGGGPTGQAGGIIIGFGRGPLEDCSAIGGPPRNSGFLPPGSWVSERKKYWQQTARRRVPAV